MQRGSHIISFLFAAFICCVSLQAQPYCTRVIRRDIHTLRVRYVGAEQPQRPYLLFSDTPLNGSEPTNTLEISFDEFSHDFRQYSYTVRHLNRDWTPSQLSSYEYLQGFTTADITDYMQSLNTRQAYTHYSFTFPNEDMQLLVSGNYVLHIYQDGDVDNGVADICFSVVEPLAGISAKVRSNTDVEFDGRFQQLDIDVETSALDVHDPNLLTLVVRQNNRLDNQATVTAPTYVEPNRLRYCNKRELIFEGGNEFRHFDAYSTYYAGYHVDVIRYGQGDYHAILDVDELRGTMAKGAGREGLSYLTEQDTNGQWIVNAERTDDADTEAEYLWVHFALPVPQMVLDGNVFVGGDVFYNLFTADNLMQYDPDEQCYYLRAYLKQGAYDYLYYVVPSGTTPQTATTATRTPATLLPLEGSHWQTHNAYTIYIYYRPFGCRYDRLVGLQTISN